MAGPTTSSGATLVERVVRHERAFLVFTIAAVTLACWSWIVPMARDMYGAMSGPSAWMMTGNWDTTHLLMLGAMWIVMMAGMMLPSAAPLLLLYAGAARRSGREHRPGLVYAMAAGYLVVWIGFSMAAVAIQRGLSALVLLSPMMESASPQLSAALLVAAGLYQLTPLKRVCLSSCRTPIAFLIPRWREGPAGAFRLGLEHGLFCLGCCWALMLLLFAGGVMNLAVIGALTAFVLFEKLTPLGPQSVRITGSLLIAAGLWVGTR